MTSVRLSREMERKLDSLAKLKHKPRSVLIKEALEMYFAEEESKKDSFESGKAFFGRYGSGEKNLSTEYKTRLKEKFSVKNNTH